MPPPPPPPPPPAVPPAQVGSIPAQIVNVGESAVIDVAPYFSDPDGGPLSYAAATSSPGVVSVSISGSSLTMVGVADGTATVVVTATDPDRLSATQTVGVTVQTPNRAPVPSGSIPAQSVNVGRTVTVDVAPYFSDPDGDALRYAATTAVPGVVSVSMSGSRLTMVGVADGTAAVVVTATDPGGLIASQSVGVSVQTPNRAPAPSGTIPAQSLNPGRTAALDVASYFSDPDGDALRYAATTSNADVVSVGVSGSTLTLTGEADGTATVTVTATDPDGLSATQTRGRDGADAQPRPGAVRFDSGPEPQSRADRQARCGSVLQRSGRRRAQICSDDIERRCRVCRRLRQRADAHRGGGRHGDGDGDGDRPGRSERDAERGRDGADAQPPAGAIRLDSRPEPQSRADREARCGSVLQRSGRRRAQICGDDIERRVVSPSASRAAR